MRLASSLIGLAVLGCVALSSGTVSATPAAAPAKASAVVVPPGHICNEWGHCWHRHSYTYGYYHPYAWGGWGSRWHRYWRPHEWSNWGWHHWHHWHRWYSGN